MAPLAASLEPAIIRIGTRLSQLSAGRAPTVFDARWWSQGVINLAMKDPAFKVQLFRFIDVLPALDVGPGGREAGGRIFRREAWPCLWTALGDEGPCRDKSGGRDHGEIDSSSSRADGTDVHCRRIGGRRPPRPCGIVEGGTGLVG